MDKHEGRRGGRVVRRQAAAAVVRPHAELHLSGRAQARSADASRGAVVAAGATGAALRHSATGAASRGGGGRPMASRPHRRRHALAGGTARDGQHGREVVRYSRGLWCRARSLTHVSKNYMCMCQWRVRDDGARYISSERNYAHARERVHMSSLLSQSHSHSQSGSLWSRV